MTFLADHTDNITASLYLYTKTNTEILTQITNAQMNHGEVIIKHEVVLDFIFATECMSWFEETSGPWGMILFQILVPILVVLFLAVFFFLVVTHMYACINVEMGRSDSRQLYVSTSHSRWYASER